MSQENTCLFLHGWNLDVRYSVGLFFILAALQTGHHMKGSLSWPARCTAKSPPSQLWQTARYLSHIASPSRLIISVMAITVIHGYSSSKDWALAFPSLILLRVGRGRGSTGLKAKDSQCSPVTTWTRKSYSSCMSLSSLRVPGKIK